MHRVVPYVCVGLMLGIAVRSHGDYGWPFVAFLVVTTLCVGVLWYECMRRHTLVLFVALLLLCGAIGYSRMELAVPYRETHVVTGETITLTGTIIREPDARGGHTNITLDAETLDEHVLVRISPYTDVAYGDTVSLTGVLETVENFQSDTERVFNYRGYLAKDNIHYIVAFPEHITVTNHRTTLTGVLLELKHTYLTALKRLLPEPTAALAGGITVGERRSLGDTLTQQFRDVGLIHIVVLSGYNIAVITLFIIAVLSFLPRRARYISAIVGIILFTILVGASATVVRAAIMGCIGALGASLGRSYDALHTLLLAAIGMLMWNPYLLVYDPSFQLSFIATFGLLVGLPLITPYLTYIPEYLGLRDIVGATISTYVAVLPLLTYMVGSVSLVALVVNVLVLPLIPLAMLAVFLVGVVGMVSSTLALPFVAIAYTLLMYVITVTKVFAELPVAALHVPAFSISWVGIAYILLAVGVYIKKKGRLRLL